MPAPSRAPAPPLLERRTLDLAYEAVGGYRRPERLPPIAPIDFYVDAFVHQTSLSPGAARIALRASGFLRFLERLSADSGLYDSLLRTQDLRAAPFSLMTLSATAVLDEDPDCPDPLRRAARLIVATRALFESLWSGTLSQDMWESEPAEMGQYANLIATSVFPGGSCSRVFKARPRSHIIVAIGGQFYVLDIYRAALPLGPVELCAALQSIVEDARRSGNKLQHRVALASAGAILERALAVRQLRHNRRNRANLDWMTGALFCLCLDLDSEPKDAAETGAIVQARGYSNRWYFSSLQVVVCANAKAGLLFSYACGLDGNVMARAAQQIVRRSLEVEDGVHASSEDGWDPAPPRHLSWDISPRLRRRLRHVERGLQPLLASEHGCLSCPAIGYSRFRRFGLSSDAMFNIALLLAVRRASGRHIRVMEHATMSRFRNMGLTMASVSTPESRAFVDYMQSGPYDPRQAGVLLRRANDAHREALRSARQFISLRWLTMLYARSSSWPQAAGAWLLALRAAGRPEAVVSRPQSHPEVVLFGRPGVRLPFVAYFGLHYAVHPDATDVVIAPSVSGDTPLREFGRDLCEALRTLGRLPELA